MLRAQTRRQLLRQASDKKLCSQPTAKTQIRSPQTAPLCKFQAVVQTKNTIDIFGPYKLIQIPWWRVQMNQKQICTFMSEMPLFLSELHPLRSKRLITSTMLASVACGIGRCRKSSRRTTKQNESRNPGKGERRPVGRGQRGGACLQRVIIYDTTYNVLRHIIRTWLLVILCTSVWHTSLAAGVACLPKKAGFQRA